MLRAPGEARNTAIAAMSSGALARPIGIRASASACSSATVMPRSAARAAALRAPSSVRVTPGQIALTLILWRPSCWAAIFVKAMTGALARGIGGIRRAGITPPGDRSDVDDPPAAPVDLILPDHLARGALQAEKDTLGVDPVDAVPIRFGQVHDLRVAGDPGVVDDDVEPAELGDGARDHRVDARHIAAIGLDGDRPPGIARRLIGRPLRGGEVDISSRNRRSGLG